MDPDVPTPNGGAAAVPAAVPAVLDDVLGGLLGNLPLASIVRIDVALEGDWSGTVVPVWTRADGLLGFDDIRRADPARRPALELYFPGYWIGLHCYAESGGRFEFDEARARALIDYVERRLAAESAGSRTGRATGAADRHSN